MKSRLEGGFLVKKKSVILTLILILFGMGIFLVNWMQYTTYGAGMANLFSEGEIIDEIIIENRFENYGFKLEDDEEIKKFIAVPSNMRLKRDQNQRMEYDIFIRTNKKSYLLALGKDGIQIDRNYKIIGDNILFQLIENWDMEYEHIDLRTNEVIQ